MATTNGPTAGITPRDNAMRDGRTVHLRAVSPADEAEVLQTFERMSDEARYMRFMRVVRTPDLQRLREALASFPEAGIGLVATVPASDGLDIVGSAVAVFSEDRTTCEFAVNVASSHGGVGLATLLMTALIDEARRRGLKEMEGFVLSQNHGMLGVAKRLGFRIAYEPGDASVRVCRLTLNPPEAPPGG